MISTVEPSARRSTPTAANSSTADTTVSSTCPGSGSPVRFRNSHTHLTHPFNRPFSGNTRVSRYQKGKPNLDFTEARDSEWQWHQLGHTQVCTSLQTDNHASTPPLSFLQAGCPSCRPTNSVKALKARFRNSLNKISLRIYTEYQCFLGGSVAEWLACWTQAQKGLGSNRSRDAVG